MQLPVKLCFPDVFIYTSPAEGKRKSHFIWQETLLDVSTPVWSILGFLKHAFACACVSISLHACVFFFGSVMAAGPLFPGG